MTTCRLFARLIGKCAQCGRGVVVDDAAASVTEWSCPHCGTVAPVRVAKIRAVVTDRPCDARCSRATGPTCECSCGGRRHGSDWQVTP